jgi:hypothetical protein
MAVLHDKAAPARQRLEALKFVVHFVADIHQPLHCADDGDRGGNRVRVIFLGRNTNLHAVWDWGILAPAVAGDERASARSSAMTSPDGAAARRQAGQMRATASLAG